MRYFYPENGIFHGILRNIVDDGGLKSKIEITTYRDCAPPQATYAKEQALNYSNPSSYWLSSDMSNFGQYYQIELLDRWVSLTHFAFSSISSGYPFSISFLTSTDGLKWDEIYKQENSILFQSSQIISVKKKVARFFRWVNNGNSASESFNTNFFRISLLDLYGTVTLCSGTCSSPPTFVSLPQFVRACTIYFPTKHFKLFIFHLILI